MSRLIVIILVNISMVCILLSFYFIYKIWIFIKINEKNFKDFAPVGSPYAMYFLLYLPFKNMPDPAFKKLKFRYFSLLLAGIILLIIAAIIEEAFPIILM